MRVREPLRLSAAALLRSMRARGGPLLGVHLRGTDKPGGRRRGVRAFLPLIRAYLCHRPLARIFVATDDATLLAELREELFTFEERETALKKDGRYFNYNLKNKNETSFKENIREI